MKKTYLGIWAAMAFLCTISTYAQKDYSSLIKDYLQKKQSNLRLDPSDFSNLEISDQYYTKSMDMVHVYTIQKINNIPVFNAISNFAIKNDEIVYFGNRFKTNLKKRANASSPSLMPNQAVHRAAEQLGLTIKEPLKILSTENSQEFLFSKAGISQTEIPVKLVYQSTEDEGLQLAWDLSILTIDREHWWSVRVDALTGKIIDKYDQILRCAFSETPYGAHVAQKTVATQTTFGKAPVSFIADGSQYKVFELPLESPNHGNRSIVSEPADATASPYGWHDTDGVVGPEFTITRGNNAYASEDRNGDFTSGYSPDGGTGLDFNFPLNLNRDPSNYIDAAVTNLFYMNNMMHDIWYQYGFDEASGNFQQTNYTSMGSGNDPVIATAQAGANSGPGDNAIFFPAPEGQTPFMLMFTWAPSGTPQIVTINSPTGLAGTFGGMAAGFGGPIPITGVTADFVLAEDDNSGGTSTDINDACDVITNAANLSGKIAVIRRGECSFGDKVLKAQNAGAVAVIIVNDQSGYIVMGGNAPSVTIPSVMISLADGNTIITALMAGNTINGTIIESGPFQKDGDLDNGIIAHEYGHGISNRLTGGPSNSDCLANDEQMGEGWSDFFGLVLTMRPGDQGTDSRGYGTYVTNQPVNGQGIRQYPYTTNMTVNPYTYADVQNQYYFDQGVERVHVHGVGSIWASVLWDMTWSLIDQYGFDPDLYNGTGGNNIAMQLVIDGLKLQPCSPGFVDGRDAILAADQANNNGANQCLIWEVFARRGVGDSASQGSSDDIHDQTIAFDMPPTSELNCTAGTSDFDESYFQLYPNPTHGTVNIASTKIHGEVQISLFDINGKKVMTQKVDMDGKASMDVSHLTTGIYVVQFVSNEKTQTEKLIIE